MRTANPDLGARTGTNRPGLRRSGLRTERHRPMTREAMLDIDACLRHLVQAGGSDLHLKVPSPPLIRLDGELVPVPGTEPLTPQDTEHAVFQMLQDKDKLAGVRRGPRGRLRVRHRGHRPLPRQRLPPARGRSRSSAARSRSTSARSTSSACRRSSASWPRRSAGSSSSRAPRARASRRRSPR